MLKPRYTHGRVSLERALSKLGIASRTQARLLILDGLVSVHGIPQLDPSFPVTPESAAITVRGTQIQKAPRIVLMLHKPRGLVTTRSDEKGRPTVFSLLKDFIDKNSSTLGHLSAVGRLDMATTGLLLFTNDTKFAALLTDPENQIPRCYVVSVRGLITAEKLDKLKNGIVDAGEKLQPNQITLRKSSNRESHLQITLTEGKNREIRRMFLALGHEVTSLKRLSFGGLHLGDLPIGKYREVSQEELKTIHPIFTKR